jgi:glycosyltransferase involved in cell wall biosynthesis
MDGIEWKREKWGPVATAWLYANERAACLLADHLISDHPAITPYLATRVSLEKISTNAYGADPVESADPALIRQWGLVPGGYVLAVARAQRDNQMLEIVRAFSASPRGVRLVVVGEYRPDGPPFEREVHAAAGPDVIFAGPVYAAATLTSLRVHCAFHVHGHQVGGTNPSLLEAMAAGSPVLAHGNQYSRWVAGDGAWYFDGETDLEVKITALLADPSARRVLSARGRARHAEAFTWGGVLEQYERLLEAWLPGTPS